MLTKIRKRATSDAGVIKQQSQQSLLKSKANPSSTTSGSNAEETDLDMEDLADINMEEKV